MILKGGILLGLAYASTRFTRDIDFSTDQTLQQIEPNELIDELDTALVEAVEALGYGIDCRVQGWKQKPPGEDKEFASLKISVGYADQNNLGAHRRLQNGKSPHAVKIDFSLNEPRGEPVAMELDHNQTIQTYSFHDLVAEKFRALLQQQQRKRFRRQDTYDLYGLLSEEKVSTDILIKAQILLSLKEKANARNLEVEKESMRNPEIARRSKAQYNLLEQEIQGELPKFDEAYGYIMNYYESLPWEAEENPTD